jgi:hypothetical protein
MNPLNWLKRKKPEKPKDPPDVPLVKPSPVQAVNYVRALLILKNIPFKELMQELRKLPWFKITYCVGVIIWLYMTGLFLNYLARAILP